MGLFDDFLNSQPEEKIRKSVANPSCENSQAIRELPAKEPQNSQLSQLSQPSKPENENHKKRMVKNKVYPIEKYRDGSLDTQLERIETEIQIPPVAKVANPANFAKPMRTEASFEPKRLQKEADAKNTDARRNGITDRFCSCGQLATFAWPDGRGREAWRCLECGPVRGEA